MSRPLTPGDDERLLDDVGVAVDARREVATLRPPSLLTAEPLITARIGSPSAQRVGRAGAGRRRRRRSSSTVPADAASNARQRPSGDRISPSWYW